jgi:hypothetical protein
MKTIDEMTNDILNSLGKSGDPVGILLSGYLTNCISGIVRENLIGLQCELHDYNRITDHDWSFEEFAADYIVKNPIV